MAEHEGERIARLEREVDEAMTDIQDLNNAVAALEEQNASFQATVTQAVGDLQAEVANLQAAGTDTAAIEGIVTRLQAITSSDATAQTAAAAADPGAQTPPASTTAPVDTGTPPADTSTEPPATS